MSYDVDAVRARFPALSHPTSSGQPLVYLDSAASAQKPDVVIEAIDTYLRSQHANVHRGLYELSAQATHLYEQARNRVADFIGASTPDEIVFTRGTTEAINLVAATFPLGPGDEVLVSELEHHSNFVPWQLACARTGAKLVVAPITDEGSLDWLAFRERLSPRTKLVSMAHVSNALGTVLPVADITAEAHRVGAKVLLDGAQGVVHGQVDVKEIGADLYAFSGHKVYGPTGIGALWGRYDLLSELPPYQGGGEMIREVTLEGSTWADPPARFEAGTPAIAEAIGLGVAVQWFTALGREQAASWEAELLSYGTELLASIDGLRMIGTSPRKAGVLGFVIEGVHGQDLATLLDEQGIAVRVGHHCAQPAMRRMGVTGTVRASIACYSTRGELDALRDGLRRAVRILR
ncbi:MAG: cysteine desulfurase [Myxococcales bacterium]|nr:cysteine desulfurase [Myxococcales bacterium]